MSLRYRLRRTIRCADRCRGADMRPRQATMPVATHRNCLPRRAANAVTVPVADSSCCLTGCGTDIERAQREPAVDADLLRRDVAGVVAREEGDQVGHFFGLAEAPAENRRFDALLIGSWQCQY